MGPNWLNNLLANGGNTQFAKFEPKKTKLTCVLEILILEDNKVIPLGNIGLTDKPIKPVAIKSA